MHRIGVPHSSEVSGAPEENKWVIFFPPLGALGVTCVTILNIRPSDSKFTSLDLAHYCRRANIIYKWFWRVLDLVGNLELWSLRELRGSFKD